MQSRADILQLVHADRRVSQERGVECDVLFGEIRDFLATASTIKTCSFRNDGGVLRFCGVAMARKSVCVFTSQRSDFSGATRNNFASGEYFEDVTANSSA